jgi:translation elongation factor EF-Tu-like GTPase
MTEGVMMARLLNEKRAGDNVPVTMLRGSEKLDLSLPMQ